MMFLMLQLCKIILDCKCILLYILKELCPSVVNICEAQSRVCLIDGAE